jgi:hypothetical protein
MSFWWDKLSMSSSITFPNADMKNAFASYQVNNELLKVAKPDAMVQHCLPAHRGEEITADVLEAHADEIFEEAENRLHVIMDDKKYFGEREGAIKNIKFDIVMLNKLFLNLYERLEDELFFQQAIGYYCTDGNVIGILGRNIDSEIFLRTGLENVWPIKTHIDEYGEVELFTMIELLYEYVSAPKDKYYHNWNNCGWHATKFDKKEGQVKFLKEINKLLERYDEEYYLTEFGKIHKISPNGLKTLVEEKIITGEPSNVDERVCYIKVFKV